jgi:hypothetical protein
MRSDVLIPFLARYGRITAIESSHGTQLAAYSQLAGKRIFVQLSSNRTLPNLPPKYCPESSLNLFNSMTRVLIRESLGGKIARHPKALIQFYFNQVFRGEKNLTVLPSLKTHPSLRLRVVYLLSCCNSHWSCCRNGSPGNHTRIHPRPASHRHQDLRIFHTS